MSNPFSRKSPPPIATARAIAKPLPPPPEKQSQGVEEASRVATAKFRSSSGRASTFFTGSGLTEPSFAGRFLGGGGTS